MVSNIKIYTQIDKATLWLSKYKGGKPLFACVLGFTATGLIDGISAAGLTPSDRQYTALADAEFLINGNLFNPKYSLPPLTVGASPVLISRAVTAHFNIPIYLFNTGLPHPTSVFSYDMEGICANCVSTGLALPLAMVKSLYQKGLEWGEKLANLTTFDYLVVGECVVGGTTTALAVLTGLGIEALGKVNSSHSSCNHLQKWSVVQSGLTKSGLFEQLGQIDPFSLIAAIGDPMQIFVAAIAIKASEKKGILLAGGTQMLAVYALIQAICRQEKTKVNFDNIIVGTTIWVAEDTTGDTVGLAKNITQVPLLASNLNFSDSIYPSLQAYQQGFVKEGVGAGGLAIASYLLGWDNEQLLKAVEKLMGNGE